MDTPPEYTRRRQGWVGAMRSNFLTGLVIIAPIALTAWLIWSVVGWIDARVWSIVPDGYQPDRYIQTLFDIQLSEQYDIRGFGLIVFLVFTFCVSDNLRPQNIHTCLYTTERQYRAL